MRAASGGMLLLDVCQPVMVGVGLFYIMLLYFQMPVEVGLCAVNITWIM